MVAIDHWPFRQALSSKGGKVLSPRPLCPLGNHIRNVALYVVGAPDPVGIVLIRSFKLFFKELRRNFRRSVRLRGADDGHKTFKGKDDK